MLAAFQNSFTVKFSKKLKKPCVHYPPHLWLTLHMLLHYLAKLKMPLLSFLHCSWHENLHQNSYIFLLSVIHLIGHILTSITCFWLNHNNCLSCVRSVLSSLSSSKTVCQLTEYVKSPWQCLPFQPSEMWDTHNIDGQTLWHAFLWFKHQQ